jgi:hypothetical protein
VRQSEDSERIVREMEALLRTDMTGLQDDVGTSPVAIPPIPRTSRDQTSTGRRRVKGQ